MFESLAHNNRIKPLARENPERSERRGSGGHVGREEREKRRSKLTHACSTIKSPF
jgi:hypothetical protein